MIVRDNNRSTVKPPLSGLKENGQNDLDNGESG